MKLKNIFLIILIVLALPLVSSTLGTFKQYECINIVTPLNVTSVVLTNVNTPSPNSSIIVSNQTMSKLGDLFNYTFCNTTVVGGQSP